MDPRKLRRPRAEPHAPGKGSQSRCLRNTTRCHRRRHLHRRYCHLTSDQQQTLLHLFNTFRSLRILSDKKLVIILTTSRNWSRVTCLRKRRKKHKILLSFYVTNKEGL